MENPVFKLEKVVRSKSEEMQDFEGPLDLLLHLIEKNKINIYDIPIAEITDQYLEYVSCMEEESLDVVSEFLVMAATLLDIKARMLLPREVSEEGEEEDPRAELVERLLEYKTYKYMSLELKDMEVDADKVFYKAPTIPREVEKYEEPVDLDGLNYLAGKTMDFVNKSAMNGTILAHTDGQVPNLKVTIPAQDEKSLGQLFYMYEFACGVSGYILGVNPFNQPGVESYKKNMFALLGKPGYEKEREELLKRL